MISQKLIDFTVECEVSSRAYYEKRLQRPEWPGGRSGVTEAIGYDLGYASPTKIRDDWSKLVATTMLQPMQSCAGVTGEAARQLLSQVRSSILVPWDTAMLVFILVDVPGYTAEVVRAIPGADKLSPDCLGVLFSIGYNRGNGGWKLGGDRFLEMRNIRALVMQGRLELVGAEIRRMTRHWQSDEPGSPDKGLRARRLKEAALWDIGLTKSGPPATKPVGKEKPPRQMPNQPPGKHEGGGAGGTIIAGGGLIKDALDAGVETVGIMLLGVLVVVAAVVVYSLINKWRTSQNPILARSAREPEADAPIQRAA